MRDANAPLQHRPAAGPTEEHAAALYAAHLARLSAARRGRASLECADLDYWGDRFEVLQVRFWTGCTFEGYLKDPGYWERTREEARALCGKIPHRLTLHTRNGFARFVLTLS